MWAIIICRYQTIRFPAKKKNFHGALFIRIVYVCLLLGKRSISLSHNLIKVSILGLVFN